MQHLTVLVFVYLQGLFIQSQCSLKELAKACCARHFDLLRKTSSTVPAYADELVLLVLTPFLHAEALRCKASGMLLFLWVSLCDWLTKTESNKPSRSSFDGLLHFWQSVTSISCLSDKRRALIPLQIQWCHLRCSPKHSREHPVSLCWSPLLFSCDETY